MFMLFFIIAAIAFFVGLGWGIYEDEFFYGALLGFAAALFSLILTAILAIFISCGANTEWVEVNTTEVMAVSDNVGVEGRVYLRRGYIEDKLSYYYIAETEFGLKTFSTDADNSYIKYTTEHPYVVCYKEVFTNDFLCWALGESTGAEHYVFYLPEGSVITDCYEIDLE